MGIAVNRLGAIDLDLWKRGNSNRNFNNNQNEKFDLAEDKELISFKNKEANKQNLQETAELISLAQAKNSSNFEKAYGEYLTQKWNNEEDKHKNVTLDVVKVVLNLGCLTMAKMLENLGNKISNAVSDIFNEDVVLRISSGISNLGRVCSEFCDTIANSGEERVRCPEISYQWG